MNTASRRKTAHTRNRLTGWALIVMAVVIAIITGRSLLPDQAPAQGQEASFTVTGQPTAGAETLTAAPEPALAGTQDGFIPDGVRVSVFDTHVPAVGNLDPDLLEAIRQAAMDAAQDSIEILVTSGWRSPRYQEQLLHEAIVTYGSLEEASRWVATPETSAHVTGNAIDVGPNDAIEWLAERGAAYGLCQVYENEPWHLELRPDAVFNGCPPMFPDPTFDPRMWQ
jgi:D-alanyl-D-alanine carboxypeptidase